MENEIKRWWTQAKEDMDAAKFNLEGKKYKVAGFLAQQAVEKGLKSLYIKKFKSLRKTHDLVSLAKELELKQEVIQECKQLSPAYTYTRYPDVTPIKNIGEESIRLVEIAEKILEWLEKQI